MDAAQLLAIVIGLMGLGSVMFAALRWRRDDTTQIVSQQDTLFAELRMLNEELRTTAQSLRDENAQLRAQLNELSERVKNLEHPGPQ